MQCTKCGTEGTGRFCAQCGAPLADAVCAACSAPLLPGARFCTQCGAGTPSAKPPASNAPWYAAGALLLLAIVLIVLWPTLSQSPPPEAATIPGANGAGAPPALSDDMRENADRLFNRIMAARESGDLTEAARFYPMAIQAYEASEPLDADGLYHLSLIQAASGDAAGARTSAERILEMAPAHLLGLGAAAESALLANDSAAARAYLLRFREALPTEQQRDFIEYRDHARVFDEYQRLDRALNP